MFDTEGWTLETYEPLPGPYAPLALPPPPPVEPFELEGWTLD